MDRRGRLELRGRKGRLGLLGLLVLLGRQGRLELRGRKGRLGLMGLMAQLGRKGRLELTGLTGQLARLVPRASGDWLERLAQRGRQDRPGRRGLRVIRAIPELAGRSAGSPDLMSLRIPRRPAVGRPATFTLKPVCTMAIGGARYTCITAAGGLL